MITNIIAGIIILIIVGGALAYIIKAKKNGKRCIGCPENCSCPSGACNGCCNVQKDK